MQTLFLWSVFLTVYLVSSERQSGLNPNRAPGTPVEAYILDAMGCRDNYRIATRQVNDELNTVIAVAKQCGLDASRALNFTIVHEPLTPYQKKLFADYGYTLFSFNETTHNITWHLPVVEQV